MSSERQLVQIHGRGAATNPANRFERIDVEPDPDYLEELAEAGEAPRVETRFFRDATRSIIASNDSPDVGFTHSVNPYRGCENGCVYCFARPFHEFLGLSAGLDFETRIFVKADAPALLRKELGSRRYTPVPLALSGVTDPYQPVERRLRITRGCLEVLAEARNPVIVITKRHMVTRDVDLLCELAAWRGAAVYLSITTLDDGLQRTMEPRASSPARRLAALETLSRAGIPTGVMVAPVVPGLTDHELPTILEAAAGAGARSAGFVPLRLPHAVADLFQEWLELHLPERKDKVLGRIREMRGGKLYDSRWGERMRGEGPYAEQIRALFQVSVRRLGLNRERIELSTSGFRRPESRMPGEQLGLF